MASPQLHLLSSSLRRAMGEGLGWLIGAVVCLRAAPRGSIGSISTGDVRPHNAPRYH